MMQAVKTFTVGNQYIQAGEQVPDDLLSPAQKKEAIARGLVKETEPARTPRKTPSSSSKE